MRPYVVAIIQARLTSTRLPGKIKERVGGQMILEHLVNRVHLAQSVDKVVIAAPHNPECCLNESIFIGPEHDVLDRYYKCAKLYGADIVVRITADCPFVPPFEIDRVVEHLISSEIDYCSNRPAMPDGFDVEAFTFKSLEDAWLNAGTIYDREHVTSFIRESGRNSKVLLESVKLSVDTPNDLERVRRWHDLERQSDFGDRGDRFLRDKLREVHHGEPQTESYSDIQP